MMRVPTPSPALAALALLAFVTFVGWPYPAISDAPWVTRTVHGLRVSIVIDPILDPSSKDPKHESAFDHRVRVVIVEDATGRAASIDAVELDVAPRGYSGFRAPLAPVERDGVVIFEGRTPMDRGRPYRILVHFRQAGSTLTHEARYEYRHHN